MDHAPAAICSLSTQASSSSVSLSAFTTTTSRTVWGPGALAGKFFLASGKYALDKVEHTVIRRRLAVIRRHFPHNDSHHDADLAQMYMDLIELARPGLYRRGLHQSASNFIWGQIATRQTLHLVNALVELPQDEMRLVIREVFAQAAKESADIFKASRRDNGLLLAYNIYSGSVSLERVTSVILQQYQAKGIPSFATDVISPAVQFIVGLGNAIPSGQPSMDELRLAEPLLHFIRLLLYTYLGQLIPGAKLVLSNASVSLPEIESVLTACRGGHCSPSATNRLLRIVWPDGIKPILDTSLQYKICLQDRCLVRETQRKRIIRKLRAITGEADPLVYGDNTFEPFLNLLYFSCDSDTSNHVDQVFVRLVGIFDQDSHKIDKFRDNVRVFYNVMRCISAIWPKWQHYLKRSTMIRGHGSSSAMERVELYLKFLIHAFHQLPYSSRPLQDMAILSLIFAILKTREFTELERPRTITSTDRWGTHFIKVCYTLSTTLLNISSVLKGRYWHGDLRCGQIDSAGSRLEKGWLQPFAEHGAWVDFL